MISSLVAPEPNSAEILPRRMTMTRCAMLRHSATSEVENTTASPAAARSQSRRNTSALAPMSMPRLGSSSRITAGSVESILPMTTFCWLPPDSDPIAAPPPAVLMRTLRIASPTTARSRGRDSTSRRASAAMPGSDRFSPTDIVCTSPSRCRSSGTSTRPRSMRPAMPSRETSSPRRRTRPPAPGTRPATHSSSSVRPAPISP